LAGALLKPVASNRPMEDSVAALVELRAAMDRAYGPCAERRVEMEVGGEGTLDDVLAFCRAA
jgi:hypothetical protein